MKKWPTPNRVTLRTKGAEKKTNNLGTFLQNIPIVSLMSLGRLDLGTPDLKTSRDQTPYKPIQTLLSF